MNCFSSLNYHHHHQGMDYSYLNQAAAAAAAGFEASSCALAASEMQCAGYADLGSCAQMSQAAYRYTAARAAAATAGYAAAASGGAPGGGGANSGGPPGSHQVTGHPAHHAAHAHHPSPCSVMRSQDVVHRHAASIFPSAINLQGELLFSEILSKLNRVFNFPN